MKELSTKTNVCAYCKRPGKLTREHLYPKFLYDGIGNNCLGYNEAADKVTRGERVIRDVCSVCNNDALQKLDAYGKRYFELNQLDRTFTTDSQVEVHYDYDLLLRWILKVSFNSFRTTSLVSNPFPSLVPFILTGGKRPKNKFVKLFIELIKDHKVTDLERPKVAEQFQRSGFIPCQILASGRVANRVSDVDCHCRHFQINAHRFTLFIFPYHTKPSDADAFVRLFRAQFPFTEFLDPASSIAKLRVSDRDILEIQAGDHVHLRERMMEAEYVHRRK